jgi:hypothetical protein
MARDPMANLEWSLEMASKAAWLAQNRLGTRRAAGAMHP